jgi:hypothetical protein
MNGLTKYITERPWEDTVTRWFVLVDDAYQRVVAKRGQPFRAGRFSPAGACMNSGRDLSRTAVRNKFLPQRIKARRASTN